MSRRFYIHENIQIYFFYKNCSVCIFWRLNGERLRVPPLPILLTLSHTWPNHTFEGACQMLFVSLIATCQPAFSSLCFCTWGDSVIPSPLLTFSHTIAPPPFHGWYHKNTFKRLLTTINDMTNEIVWNVFLYLSTHSDVE